MIEIIDWTDSEESKHAKAEIDFLYKWWKERTETDKDIVILTKDIYESDNRMLKRLIGIRQHLWT